METYGYEMEELIPVVAELAERYTGYEHSSVTYERAQMLMEAVLYCIGEYKGSLSQAPKAELAQEGTEKAAAGTYEVFSGEEKIPPGQARRRGEELVLEKVKKLRELYNELMPGFKDFGMICLRDTMVKGLPLFFQRYDVRFAPQETLLTLDYPVLKDIKGWTGVDAVWEYVNCIAIEQRFLGELPVSLVRGILRSYHGEYEGLIENLCSIVLRSILARIMEDTDTDLAYEYDGLPEANRQKPDQSGHSYVKTKQQALALLLRKTLKEKLDCDRQMMDYLEHGIWDAVGYALACAGDGF